MAIHSHSTEACSKSPGLNEGKLEGRASVSLGVAGRFSLGIVAGRGTYVKIESLGGVAM